MKIFFSKNLVFLRENLKLTQAEISSKYGFSRSQWTNYETGKSFPKFLDLIEIAKIFDISETDLIHSDLTKGPPKQNLTSVEKQTMEEMLEVYRLLVPQLQEKITKLELQIQRYEDFSENSKAAESKPKYEKK